MADVIATRLMLLPVIFCILADVIGIKVVDVLTTVLNHNKWQQHLPQLMAITPAIEQIEPKWAITSALVA